MAGQLKRLLCALRPRSADGERGAIIPMTAICLVVMVTSVALSVDIGMIAHRKRDLRSIADLATLDAARAIDTTGTRTAFDQQATVEAAAFQSAARNGHVPGGSKAEELTTELGVWTTATGFNRCADPIACIPNAVRVFAGETVPKYFAFFAEDRPLDLSAIGVQPYAPGQSTSTLLSNAGVTVGSFAARLDTTQAPIYDAVLGGLLGATITGVGYQGLADTNVDLAKVAARMGFGSVDQLLAAKVKVAELLTATADVLAANGAGSATVTSLGSVATSSSGASDVKLADVYRLSTGTGSVASSTVNTADLLFGVARASAAARIADGGNAIALALPVSSQLAGLGVTALTANVAVIEAPQSASGPAELVDGIWRTSAKTGQVVMALNARVSDVSLLGVSSTVDLPLLVDAGRATADLTRISCDPLRTGSVSSADGYRIEVVTSAAKIAFGTISSVDLADTAGDASFSATVGKIATVSTSLGLDLAPVTIEVRANREEVIAPATGFADFTGNGLEPDGTPQRRTVGGLTPTEGLVTTLLGGDTPVFTPVVISGGLEIGVTIGDVTTQVNTQLHAKLDLLSGPLNDLVDTINAGLGVRIGGADVTGGPRPYQPQSEIDPNPAAADCPAPIPVLVASP